MVTNITITNTLETLLKKLTIFMKHMHIFQHNYVTTIKNICETKSEGHNSMMVCMEE